MMQSRDLTFDLMKGIGIVAVLCGHFIPGVNHYVESFHMPLFFVIAGYFFKQRSTSDALKKDSQRLLIPYAIVSVILIFWRIVSCGGTIKTFVKLILSYCFGFVGSESLFGVSFSGVLVMWFLMTLFLAKSVYNFLYTKFENNRSLLGIACFVLAGLGIALKQQMVSVPFNICQAFTALPFMFAGNYCRENSQRVRIQQWGGVIICFAMIVWCLSVAMSSVDMSKCRYESYPLNFVAAVSATFLIYMFCHKLVRLKILAYLGEYSMAIMCIHNIEWQVGLWKKLLVVDNAYVFGVTHVIFVICLSCLLIAGYNGLKKIFYKQ